MSGGVIDGQPVNQTITNPAFIIKNADDETAHKLGLKNPLEGSDIEGAQTAINKLYTASGASESSSGTNYVAPANTVTTGENYEQSIKKLAYKFDPATAEGGHAHSGALGDGAPVAAVSIANVKLAGYFQSGGTVTFDGASIDVSSLLMGKTPSTGELVKGVVATVPHNRVALRNSLNDLILTPTGDEVYSRLTEAAGVWTLTFYYDNAGVETAYTIPAPVTGGKWFYQELFNPITDAPVYNSGLYIPSDNATADVITATQTQQGKVSLQNAASQSVGATNTIGTPNAKAANENHAHQGVHSIKEVTSAALYGDVELQGMGGTVISQASQTITIESAPPSDNTPEAVASTSSPGAGTDFARDDHAHEGLHSIAPFGGTQLLGDVELQGTGSASFSQAGQVIQHDGAKVGTASAQSVGASNGAGVSTSAAREDHTHQGVHSIKKTGEGSTLTGDIELEQGDNITLTQTASPNKIRIDATGGGAGGGGGAKNYIVDGDYGTFDKNITGVVVYQDVLAGTIGTPTVSVSRNTTNPLAGLADLLFTKPASNCQGQGFAIDFTIDRERLSKIHSIVGYYLIASGVYADSDLEWWVRDLTNSVNIQPSANQILNAVGATQVQPMEWQAASNSLNYRLIVRVKSTSTQAFTVEFDDLMITPITYALGAYIGPETAYTPVITGFGTPTDVNFSWTRRGNKMLIKGRFATGTVSATVASFSLPNSYRYDTTVSSPNTTPYGNWRRNVAAVNHCGNLVISPTDSVAVVYFGPAATDSVSAFGRQNGSNIFNNSELAELEIEIPILGWGVNQVLSQETDNRVLEAIYYLGPVTIPNVSASYLNFAGAGAKINDTHGAFSGDTFTAPFADFYEISCTVAFATNTSGDRTMHFNINGTVYNVDYQLAVSAPVVLQGYKRVYLLAGQTVRIGLYQTCGTSLNTYDFGFPGAAVVYIARSPGMAQVAASEKISAAYYMNTGPALSTSGYGILNFDTKDAGGDTHGAVTTGGSWRLTAPAPGWYSGVVGILTAAKTLATTEALEMRLYKNGSVSKELGVVYGNGTSANWGIVAPIRIYLQAGDYIDVRANISSAANLVVAAFANYISITREA